MRTCQKSPSRDQLTLPPRLSARWRMIEVPRPRISLSASGTSVVLDQNLGVAAGGQHADLNRLRMAQRVRERFAQDAVTW